MRSVQEIQIDIDQVTRELESARAELNQLEASTPDEYKTDREYDPEWSAGRMNYINNGDMSGIEAYWNRKDQQKRDALESKRLEQERNSTEGANDPIFAVKAALAAKLAQQAMGLPTATQDVELEKAVAEYARKTGKVADLEELAKGMGTSTDPTLIKYKKLKAQKTLSDADLQWIMDNKGNLPEAEQIDADALINQYGKGQAKTDETVATEEERIKTLKTRKASLEKKLDVLKKNKRQTSSDKKVIDETEAAIKKIDEHLKGGKK